CALARRSEKGHRHRAEDDQNDEDQQQLHQGKTGPRVGTGRAQAIHFLIPPRGDRVIWVTRASSPGRQAMVPPILMTGSRSAMTTSSTMMASTTSNNGSRSRTARSSLRQVCFSSESAIWVSTVSRLLDCSATAIISTTLRGKCP